MILLKLLNKSNWAHDHTQFYVTYLWIGNPTEFKIKASGRNYLQCIAPIVFCWYE